MVQDAFITPQELLAEIMPSTPAFSATRVIGGKLRALYDDAAQPCPDRLARLLTELNVDSLVSN
jgi:Anti-sigma factor NepR